MLEIFELQGAIKLINKPGREELLELAQNCEFNREEDTLARKGVEWYVIEVLQIYPADKIYEKVLSGLWLRIEELFIEVYFSEKRIKEIDELYAEKTLVYMSEYKDHYVVVRKDITGVIDWQIRVFDYQGDRLIAERIY
ncbi:MAG: hypothetical protein EOM23_01600 [Candidatus Moranbacteria bacterium]|nr:hypothetical protein [Candidatus Moranbacteria bacterium]